MLARLVLGILLAGSGIGDSLGLSHGQIRLSSRPVEGMPAWTQRRRSVVAMAIDRGSRAPPKRGGIEMPMNEQITAKEVRVVVAVPGEADEMMGIMELPDALAKASEMELDLVMISDKSTPPVCKIVDFGKLRYQLERKKKENAKKTKSNDIKEVKMSYKIGEHDYDVRKRSALKFLEGGHRVKCVVQFRGREQQHMDLGGDLLQKLATDCEEVGSAGGRPKREVGFIQAHAPCKSIHLI